MEDQIIVEQVQQEILLQQFLLKDNLEDLQVLGVQHMERQVEVVL